jgi:transposase
MNILLLVPQSHSFQLAFFRLSNHELTIGLGCILPVMSCPYCGSLATRQHSRYTRTVWDLPWAGRRAIFQLEVRRFFCDHPACSHATFAERFPDLVLPHSRQTNRLADLFQQIALALGGEAGARHADRLGLSISPDTLLRRIKHTPLAEQDPPRVLGIDDWAIRKGHSYATVLVDLELHRVIDLLPDRKPETVATWLQFHPGIELISRDRGEEYIQAVRQGAPGVIEIADRFHLLRNLLEGLQHIFEHSPGEIQLAARQMALSNQNPPDDSSGAEQPRPSGTENRLESGTHRRKKFDEVKALQTKGLTYREIGRQVGVDRRTVRKYFQLDAPPQGRTAGGSRSSAGPYLTYLRQRWEAGEHNLKHLYAELRQRGFQGSYSSIFRAVHHQLGAGNLHQVTSLAPPRLRLSPKQAAWAVFSEEQDLREPVKTLRSVLLLCSPLAQQADQLVRSFRSMLAQQQPDRLDDWLASAEHSPIPEFRRFAISLRGDYAAVRAALSQPWSNGQVEGQVNRLKLIKRQMYGRAGFDLLRKRVILAD